MARKVKRKGARGGGGGGAPARVAEARGMFARGEYGAALGVCEGVLESFAHHGEALALCGWCLLYTRRVEEARGIFERALAVLPRNAEVMLGLGQALGQMGEEDAALAVLERAVEVAPRDGSCAAALAKARLERGDRAGAREVVLGAMGGGGAPVGAALAVLFSRVCEGEEERASAIGLLERASSGARAGDSGGIDACFRLGALLEAEGRYAEAWRAWGRGNALHGGRIDRAGFDGAVDRAIGAWTDEVVERVVHSEMGPPAVVPVFICGMPRSGTSLVERVLSAHPLVRAAGEVDFVRQSARRVQSGAGVAWGSVLQKPELLTGEALAGMRAGYLEGVARVAGGGGRVLTDKLPANVENLGLIGAMFPEAVVVHCARDAPDVAVSRFAHAFAGALEWAQDVGDIRFYQEREARLMAHWRGVLRVPVHEVVYEDFVGEFEAGARALVGAVGLAWDARCLRFFEEGSATRTQSFAQTTLGVYGTSVGRGARFARWLERVGEKGDRG